MRRVYWVLLIGYGAWAQQPAAKAPTKSDAALTAGSFSVSGLHNEKLLTDFFTGDFVDIPFDRDKLAFVSMFEDYLESYGRHCDRYLPSNKVELTRNVCAVQETRIDRYGNKVSTGNCSQYTSEGMGIYADPGLYAAKSKLGDDAGLSMIKDVFQTMKQANPLGAALNTVNETRQMGDDMDGLFRLNSCVSPGVKRFQENVVLFSMGKQPIVLPGSAASVAARTQTTPSGPFKDQNYTKLLEDLIQDQSTSWLFNRYVSGSTSNVVVSSRDSAGRPAKIVGKYLFNGRSQGSVTVSFSDGMPECLYFFDLPSTCKSPNRRMVAAYSNGGYPIGASASAASASPAVIQPVRQVPNREVPAKAVPPAAPAVTVTSTPTPNPTPTAAPAVPAMTPEERREKQVTESQIRAEKVKACRTAFQQALKDQPQAGIELTKEYTSCVQAAQPAKGGTR